MGAAWTPEHLTDEALDQLQAVAEAATPGERTRIMGDYGRRIGNESVRILTGRLPVMFRVETPDPQHHYDAAYLCTFGPDLVLALIERSRRLNAVEGALEGEGA